MEKLALIEGSELGFLISPSPTISRNGLSLTEWTQQEIDDTVRQMQTNIQLGADRGVKVDHLQDQTSNLADQAQGFRRGANRVRKDMWWKDMKMRMCIIIGIIVLLIVIIVPSGKHYILRLH